MYPKRAGNFRLENSTQGHKGAKAQRKLKNYSVSLCLCVSALIFITACEPIFPTSTPTSTLSAPPLAPSATIEFRSSDDLQSVGGQNEPTSAASVRDHALPPVAVGTPEISGIQSVQIFAEDGATLSGDLYQSGMERLPGLLIVGMDKSAWGTFPQQLRSAGFTVLVMDLRPTSGTADMQTMLTALSGVGTVDPSRIGVVGESAGASVALLGCAVDLRCDAVALFSPMSGDTLLNVMPNYNPRPLFLAASQNDAESFPTASALQQSARGAVEFRYYENAGRGAQMLQFQPELAETLITWLAAQLG